MAHGSVGREIMTMVKVEKEREAQRLKVERDLKRQRGKHTVAELKEIRRMLKQERIAAEAHITALLELSRCGAPGELPRIVVHEKKQFVRIG